MRLIMHTTAKLHADARVPIELSCAAERPTAPSASATAASRASRRLLHGQRPVRRPQLAARTPATSTRHRAARRRRRRRTAAPTPAAHRAPARPRQHLRGRDTDSATTRARSSSTGGKLDSAGAWAGAGGAKASRFSSIAQVRAGRPRVRDAPVGAARRRCRRPRRRAAAGRTGPDATARCRPGRPSSSTRAARATNRADSIASAQLPGRPAPHQPGGSRSRRPAPWPGAGVARARCARSRPARHRSAGGRRPAGRPTGRLGRRQEHQAHLEQRQIPAAPAEVAGQVGQQPGQQRGAQLRLGVRDRVGQPQRPAPVGVRRPARRRRASPARRTGS